MHKWIHACMCDSVCIRKLLRFSLVLIDLTVERISYTSNVLDWYGLEGIHIHTQICVCVSKAAICKCAYRIKRYTQNTNHTLITELFHNMRCNRGISDECQILFIYFSPYQNKIFETFDRINRCICIWNHSIHKTFSKLKCLLSK